jgi:hypothetical protein
MSHSPQVALTIIKKHFFNFAGCHDSNDIHHDLLQDHSPIAIPDGMLRIAHVTPVQLFLFLFYHGTVAPFGARVDPLGGVAHDVLLQQDLRLAVGLVMQLGASEVHEDTVLQGFTWAWPPRNTKDIKG